VTRRSMRGVLLDVERVAKRKGATKALELVGTTNCPTCKASIEIETIAQPALLRHGGHGATLRTSTAHCHDCGWALTLAVDEVNPKEKR